MTRLLFWIALAVLVIMAIRHKLRAAAARPQAPQRPSAPVQLPSEPMASCAHCGIYFPASEAVVADGRAYCCPAHVRLPPTH
jgi:uncharacterized protein